MPPSDSCSQGWTARARNFFIVFSATESPSGLKRRIKDEENYMVHDNALNSK
jgi:hypothetical protein